MKDVFSMGNPQSLMFYKKINSSVAYQLFNGFDELYFVSFVTSLRSLLKLYETNGLKKLRVLLVIIWLTTSKMN